MISDELFERYHIDKSLFDDDMSNLYQVFLVQTDYISIKLFEQQMQGKYTGEDYTEVLKARQFAREQLGGQANVK